MQTENSQTRLREYADTGSESAFRALTSTHVGLVYSAALRLVGGDRHLAEDVTQTVFIQFARKAKSLHSVESVGGWLHRHTCFVAKKAIRQESRRRHREQEALAMKSLENNNRDASYEKLAPILDESIQRLSLADRTAVVMRFFEDLDFQQMGSAMGSSSDAARMRVNRALSKLRRILADKGVTLSTATLTTFLVEKAVAASPSGLSLKIATASLVSAAVPTGILESITQTLTMMNIKSAVTGVALVAGIATPVAIHTNAKNQIDQLNQVVQQRTVELETLQNERSQPRLILSENELPHDILSELLALRGEVALLRKQSEKLELTEKENANLKKMIAEIQREFQQALNATLPPEQSEFQALGISKMNDAKNIVIKLITHSNKNEGFLPNSMEEFMEIMEKDPADQDERSITKLEDFELLYAGKWEEIESPEKTILVREKQPWQTPEGKWVKTYGFADGHSEVYTAPNGDFAKWESERLPRLAPEE